MKELNKYLDTFSPILEKLDSTNVRLGGTLILKLHGLNFSRPIGDLDVIITNPTTTQWDYLKDIEFFQSDESYSNQYNFKFKKENLHLNILLIENHNDDLGNLFYTHGGKMYRIISIAEIINAKKKYSRSKDISDFLLLKNENFNI